MNAHNEMQKSPDDTWQCARLMHATKDFIQVLCICGISLHMDRNLCQDLCFLQWNIKIEKSKILHCKKASSNTDMSLLQYVNNTIN